MQRQSLGSPGKSLNTENKLKSGFSPPADLTASASVNDIKTEKPVLRQISQSERSIHLVPILILLCFTILFIFSHEPSTEDLSSFVGFSRLVNRKGVWSHRALKEDGGIRYRRMGAP